MNAITKRSWRFDVANLTSVSTVDSLSPSSFSFAFSFSLLDGDGVGKYIDLSSSSLADADAVSAVFFATAALAYIIALTWGNAITTYRDSHSFTVAIEPETVLIF